jgi:hypothetical protein
MMETPHSLPFLSPSAYISIITLPDYLAFAPFLYLAVYTVSTIETVQWLHPPLAYMYAEPNLSRPIR